MHNVFESDWLHQRYPTWGTRTSWGYLSSPSGGCQRYCNWGTYMIYVLGRVNIKGARKWMIFMILIANDIWGWMRPTSPEFCLTVEEELQKNLNQENWPDEGSNTGPLGERQRCYPSTAAVVIWQTLCKSCLAYEYEWTLGCQPKSKF